jgi:tetratricopeptide (TPR) repeat protein
VPAWSASSAVIGLNNEGVRALSNGNYEVAVEKFEAALRLDPEYQLAKDNLAIAYNNYGLAKQNAPDQALKLFHKALGLSPSNRTTKANLEAIIRLMNMDPNSFADRVKVGDQARKDNDLEGAQFEYEEALNIKTDDTIKTQLESVKTELRKRRKSEAKSSSSTADLPTLTDKTDALADYAEYVAKRAKKYWKVSKVIKSTEVWVIATIDKDGKLADVNMEKAGEWPLAAESALDSIKKAAPYKPLPPDSPGIVNIRITFKYKR